MLPFLIPKDTKEDCIKNANILTNLDKLIWRDMWRLFV